MKKLLFFTLLILYVLDSFGQERTTRMTFLIVIDNEFPTHADIIDSKFLLKDSTGTVKDEINFDYDVGKLLMPQLDYIKLFKIKPEYNLFIKFSRRNLALDSDYKYEVRIPTKYINEEYPTGFINVGHIILKIYNAFNDENRVKFFFKKDENYIYQLTIPGMGTILTTLQKN